MTKMKPVSGPARPPSPSNSFYALSDDEEGEYNTITHTASGRGVKLLYSKSKVNGVPCDEIEKHHDGGVIPWFTTNAPHRSIYILRRLRRTIYQDTLLFYSRNQHLILVLHPPRPRPLRKPRLLRPCSSHGFPNTPLAMPSIRM